MPTEARLCAIPITYRTFQPFKRTRKQRHGFRARMATQVGRLVVLSTLDAPELPFLKAVFITTKRVGRAHERNLPRRRQRALAQKHGGRLIDPHRHLVTIPRTGSAGAWAGLMRER